MRRDTRPGAGFTLIEVLAALLISAVALTFLLQAELNGVRQAGYTQDLRAATLLGYAKLQALACGDEKEAAGRFEDREEWTWEASLQPFEPAPDLQRMILTVFYRSGAKPRTLTLEQVVRP